MRRRLDAAVIFCLAAACAPASAPPDAGGSFDAGLDAASDVDAGLDAASDVDASLDADTRDATIDASPPDAGLGRSPVVDALVALRCEVRARAECRTPWTCGCPDVGPPPSDAAACERAVVAACSADADRDALEGLVRHAELTIDDAFVADCRRTTERAFDLCRPPRRDFFATYGACLHALRGTPALGDACGYVGLCADGEGLCDGATCRPLPALDAPCTTACRAPAACVGGTCALPVASGGRCTDDEDCAAPEPCVGGVCGAPAARGEPCADTARCAIGLRCEGGRCVDALDPAPCRLGTASCGAGETCQPALVRRCLPRGDVGAPCASDEACRPELVCSGRAERPGVCRVPPSPGEPCFERCAEGAVCAHVGADPAGVCAVAPDLGAPCDAAWAFTSCGPGRVCDGFEAYCKPIPGLGEPCEGLCTEGLACDFTASPPTCVPALGDGARCDGAIGPTDCAPGLACDTSLVPWACRSMPSEGAPCDWSRACAPGLDCLGLDTSTAPVCVLRPRLDEACGVTCEDGAYCDFDFASGRCALDVCGLLPRPSSG